MTVDWKKNAIQVAGTASIGLSAGLAAVAFHHAMIWLTERVVEIPSHWAGWQFALMVLGCMAAAAFITGVLMKYFAPDAPGSGIPQVKAGYHGGKLDFTWRLILVKFFGGALSIGTGSSMGREGPTVHIGAAIASKVAKLLGEGPAAKANAVCAGSAAGLAAAFSSPLAGVTLVMEEIAGGKNQSKFAGRSLLAAALAASVVYGMTGGSACLPIGPDMPMHWKVLALSPLTALFSGGAGLLFQKFTIALRQRSKNSALPGPLKLGLGALGGGAFGLAAFALTGQLGVFALGEEDLLGSLHNHISWPVAAILLFAKIAATSLCYGSGGCGGIFAPIIFFGGMAGVVIYGLSAPWINLTAADQTLLSLVGMTACLSAVMRAPLTSILIVMEMTWQIHVLPALMVAAVIGVFLNRTFFVTNLYDATLIQDGIIIKE